MQSDILEERYAIKFCMNRASVFEWHMRFKEGRESVKDDKRCGRSKEVRTPELIGQIKNFMGKDRRASIKTHDGPYPQCQCGSCTHNYSRGTEDAEELREVCPKSAHPCHRLFDQDGHQDSSSPSV